jgi:signal peptidase I
MRRITSKTLANAILLIMLGMGNAVASPYYPPESPPAAVTDVAIAKARELAESVGGKDARIASTGSMAPTLQANEIIVYRPAKVAELNVGDIIVFQAQIEGAGSMQFSLVTHRIVHKDDRLLRVFTKGDHNKQDDQGEVPEGRIKGVVVYVVNGDTGAVREMR